MGIISIYIPDSGMNRALDAICQNYKYQAELYNPLGGQKMILWSSGVEYNNGLLPIASGQGYIGLLPGAKSGEYIYPLVLPFVESNATSGLLGVVTGVYPIAIPNPKTKSEFVNSVLRDFIAEHVKSYELEVARKDAEIATQNAGNIIIDDGATAKVYNYHMVCLQPAKPQYDVLASVIASGNEFHLPLSPSGFNPPTHYGLEAGITESARQQLLVLEMAGGTSTNGIQTLFYVRCDPVTEIAQTTNISGYDIIGKKCSMSKMLEFLQLKEII
jgi:hypothetical protein